MVLVKPASGSSQAIGRMLRRQIGADVPGRERICDMLLDLRVPNISAIGPAAGRLLQVETQASWLFDFIAPEAADDLRRGLGRLCGSSLAMPDFKGQTERFQRLATLATPAAFPLGDLERLRGIFILGLAARRKPGKKKIKAAHADRLGSFIRGTQRQRVRDVTAQAVQCIARESDLLRIAERLELAWKDDPAEIATDWRTIWAPWIRDITGGNHLFEPEARIDQPKPWVHVPSGPRGNFGWEPPTELGIEIIPIPPISTKKGISHPPSTFAVAFAQQAIRARNTALLKLHAEVATDGEVDLLIQHVMAHEKLETGAIGVDSLATGVVLLLQTITGRTLSTALDTYFLDHAPKDEAHVVIDLSTGTLRQPLLKPPQSYKPDHAALSLVEPSLDTLELQLPPALVRLMETIQSRRPARQLQDWFAGKEPEVQVRRYLRSVEGLTAFGCEPARFRRWAAPQVQSVGADIAHTMLICGDTFGRSTAPLYYCAPLHTQLQDVFRRAVWPIFGDAPTAIPSLNSAERLGPAHLAKNAVVRKGIVQLSNRLNDRSERVFKKGRKRCIEFHNRFTDYLSHYIAIITSHRPHQSLFALQLTAFDLEYDLAVLRDKEVDLAHLTRLTCCTPNLSRQVGLYLAHLQALSAQPWATGCLKDVVDSVQAGRHPLLVYLDDDLVPRIGVLQDWKRGRPESWEHLEGNWYRAYASTRLKEWGAPAIAVFSHVGHLESANYPHSAESPIAPIDLLSRTRDALTEMERELGFRVMPGLADPSFRRLLPALRNWDADIAEHEQAARAATIEQRRIQRSLQKENRIRAVKWLQDNLPLIDASLAASLNWLRTHRRGRGAPEEFKNISVSDACIKAILAQMQTELGAEDGLQIAVHNRLCHWLRSAVERLEMRVMDIGLFNLRPHSELSPFLPNSCIAGVQMRAIRRHLCQQFKDGKEMPHPVRRALALLCYGNVTSENDVLRLATEDRPWASLHSVPGAVIDLTRDSKEAIVGIATLAFGTGANQLRPNDTATNLSIELSRFLPDLLVPTDPSKTLKMLCATAEMVSRIERSGLSRMASAQKNDKGVSMLAQAAFLNRQLIRKPVIDRPLAEAFIDKDVFAEGNPERVTETISGHAAARVIYARLVRAVSDPSTYLSQESPKKRKAPQPQYKASLSDIRNAVDVVMPSIQHDEHTPLTIGQALAEFVRDMTVHGTQKRSLPANTTVATYLSAIGPELVEVFSGFDLRDLSGEDIEEAYQLVLAAKALTKTARRAAGQLLHFHEVMVRVFELPQIDAHWLGRGGDETDRPIVLISDAQYELALGWLQSQCRLDMDHTLTTSLWRRHCLCSAVALILLRRAGGRLGEISWLQIDDLLMVKDRILIVIRPSVFRSLKTAAARRLIDLTDRLTSDERALLLCWVHGEKLRLGAEASRALLFGALDDSRVGIGSARLRDMVKLAFEHGAGLSMWPHLLRHSWISQEYPAAAGCLESTIQPHQNLDALQRQFRAVVTEAGHVSATTGLVHYCHVNWLFHRPVSEKIYGQDSMRWLLSGLSGMRVASVDKTGQRQGKVVVAGQTTKVDSASWAAAVGSALKPARIKTVPYQVPRFSNVRLPKNATLPPVALDDFLRVARGHEDLAVLGPVFGLSRVATDRLSRSCDRLAAISYYRLLPGRSRKGNVVREPIPRSDENGHLKCFGVSMDADTATDLGAALERHYSPTQAKFDRFSGSVQDILNLRLKLESAGLATALLSVHINQGSASLSVSRKFRKLSLFHALTRALAVLNVWAGLLSEEAILSSSQFH